MRKEFRGYDPADVDAFLARCLATPGVYRSKYPQLRGRTPSGPRVTAQEIRDVRFRKATWGYQMRVVDTLLDELADAVELTGWSAPGTTVAVAPMRRTIVLEDTAPASPGHGGEHRPQGPRVTIQLPDHAPSGSPGRS